MKLVFTKDTDQTSKICYLLSAENFGRLQDFDTDKLSKALGKRNVDYVDIDKGYTDPEWIYKLQDGTVVGIGFRYGTPRLRGRDVHPLIANNFIKLVHSKIQETECLEHGGLFDDNPGKNTCKTCEDWLVKEGR